MGEQTIIVVCGPDMTGKTNITLALEKILKIPRFKSSSEHDMYLEARVLQNDRFINGLRHADTRMVDFLEQTGHSVIFDRAWPCEYSYAKVFNRETDMDVLRYVDDKMKAMGAKVVICTRLSYRGIVDDIDPTTKEGRLKELDDAYNEFSRWTDCECMFLNVDDEDLQREVSDVLQFMGYDQVVRAMMVAKLPRKP